MVRGERNGNHQEGRGYRRCFVHGGMRIPSRARRRSTLPVLVAGAFALGAQEGAGDDPPLVVLDVYGEQPIAGARVMTRDGRVLGETDATGACTRVTREERGLVLHVDKPGYAHAVLYPTPAPEPVAFLEPLLTLRGRVLAEDTGLPVPGARLALAHLECAVCAPAQAVSDGAGRYVLPGARPDFLMTEVSIEAPGFARNRLSPLSSSGSWSPEHDFV